MNKHYENCLLAKYAELNTTSKGNECLFWRYQYWYNELQMLVLMLGCLGTGSTRTQMFG